MGFSNLKRALESGHLPKNVRKFPKLILKDTDVSCMNPRSGFIIAACALFLLPVPGGVAKSVAPYKSSQTRKGMPVAGVSKEILRKVEKLSQLRTLNKLPAVKRGDLCYLDRNHQAPNGEARQACVIFLGQHRCLVSNFQKMKCGLPRSETTCKVLKTGGLVCEDPSKMVAINTTCRYDRYGFSVCKMENLNRSQNRMPASQNTTKQPKQRPRR